MYLTISINYDKGRDTTFTKKCRAVQKKKTQISVQRGRACSSSSKRRLDSRPSITGESCGEMAFPTFSCSQSYLFKEKTKVS